MSEAKQNQGTYKKTSPTNYYSIQNWMTHECGLKYPQRDIYAILYGFTQDRTQWVEPTQSYIAELVGISRQSVNENIAKLTEEGWLKKVTRIIPGRGTRSFYQTVTPAERKASEGGVNQDDTGCQLELQGVSTTLTGGVNQDDTDNKTIINPISNTISTHTDATAAPGGNSAEPSFPRRCSSPKKEGSKKSKHTQGGAASASETLRVNEKVAAKAARVSVSEGPSFEEFDKAFYKPTKPDLRRKAKKEWDKLLLNGKSSVDIMLALSSYKAMKEHDGITVRYWANMYDFLTTWVDYDYGLPMVDVLATSGISKAGKPADPARVAAVKASIAGEKPETDLPATTPCPICGTSSKRGIGDKYECPKCVAGFKYRQTSVTA